MYNVISAEKCQKCCYNRINYCVEFTVFKRRYTLYLNALIFFQINGLTAGNVFPFAVIHRHAMTFFDHSTPFNIDLTVSLSMGVAVVLAKTLGCILPILAKAVKLDPAMMAGPLISTVVDAIALVVYFSIATVLVL